MAAVMGATYPDIFSAIGVHSGLPYRSASDVVSAFAAMRGNPAASTTGAGDPPKASGVRTIVFHGDADPVVHPSNAARFVAAQVDAGRHVTNVEARDATGRPSIRTIVHDEQGSVVFEQWLISGAGHAWAGGNAEGSYTDPSGPDASREMLRFFLQREVGTGSREYHAQTTIRARCRFDEKASRSRIDHAAETRSTGASRRGRRCTGSLRG
jgi:poly(3-hydroxybutyrate) depolymerase